MAQPRVPGDPVEGDIVLPCGEELDLQALDLGLRELQCDCGAAHAVVMDVHPPTRFLPAFLVETLRGTIETADDFGSFGTPHLLGSVREERPESVVSYDASDDGSVGFAMVWITDESARELHERVVELVVDLMEHALGHAEDEDALAEFQDHLATFDVETFVSEYREQRDFEDEHDRPV